MRRFGLFLVLALFAMPLAAQNRTGPTRPTTGRPQAAQAPVPLNQADQAALQRAAVGDLSGGRFIPKPILEILADPRIDPNIAYILWQTARKPMDDWTLNELTFVMQVAPTLAETGIPVAKLQALYQFLGLDPNDLFNPQPGQNWQSQSTAFDPRSSANVNAISSADCQVDPSQPG
jgi:hypothetical protein